MILVNNRIATRDLQRLIVAGVMMAAFQGAAAWGQPLLTDAVKPPRVPANLEPPPGNKPFLNAQAAGTQNYVCLPSGWAFLGPQATLFISQKWIHGEIRQQIATHFLSPNPVEGGRARAAWQGSFDTSAVWAEAIANSSDPAFVAPGAIPWLLLETRGVQPGPTGGTLLSRTTYIQRVNTSGGVAPAAPCSVVGSTALVPYTTDYVFYKSAR
jgi:hypothetical protein